LRCRSSPGTAGQVAPHLGLGLDGDRHRHRWLIGHSPDGAGDLAQFAITASSSTRMTAWSTSGLRKIASTG
jgi:hypothetical protein